LKAFIYDSNHKLMNTKTKFPIYSIVLLAGVLLNSLSSFSQEEPPVKKERKNTVKLNITNPMLFGDNCYVVGYERTIGKHQSFSVNVGRFAMPKLFSIGTDSIKQIDNNSSTSLGLSLSGDYRFYLAKENRYNSPHGIYIGPYFARNGFTRTFELEATAGDYIGKLNADLKLGITTVGFQLGYQFVFWDRLSLDMILFGPGLSAYKIKANLSTDLDSEKESELFQKINDALAEKIPGYELVIDPGEFVKTGSYNTTNAGYRYVIMIGFRF
jgi:hypothetical protein